jgi:multiple sugar transport system substrate-binding protein
MSGKPTSEEFNKKLDHMVDTLRSEIMGDGYAPGDYLPSEMVQASRFGLSNKSVRKGLDILVAEDLIEKIPKVGSRVKGRSPVWGNIQNVSERQNLDDADQLLRFE